MDHPELGLYKNSTYKISMWIALAICIEFILCICAIAGFYRVFSSYILCKLSLISGLFVDSFSFFSTCQTYCNSASSAQLLAELLVS